MCAREHPPDDDRQPPRGLADALSRWDTEQGWMRSTPGREADSTEHVPPPESTPGQLFQPADQRRPAPPPMRSTAGTRSCRASRRRRGPPIPGLRSPSPSRSCGPRPATRSIAGYGPASPPSPSDGPPKPLPSAGAMSQAPRRPPVPERASQRVPRAPQAQGARPTAAGAEPGPPTRRSGRRTRAEALRIRVRRGRVRRCRSPSATARQERSGHGLRRAGLSCLRVTAGRSGRRRRRRAGGPSRRAGRMSSPGR